jgi:hypothetical protein
VEMLLEEPLQNVHRRFSVRGHKDTIGSSFEMRNRRPRPGTIPAPEPRTPGRELILRSLGPGEHSLRGSAARPMRAYFPQLE